MMPTPDRAGISPLYTGAPIRELPASALELVRKISALLQRTPILQCEKFEVRIHSDAERREIWIDMLGNPRTDRVLAIQRTTMGNYFTVLCMEGANSFELQMVTPGVGIETQDRASENALLDQMGFATRTEFKPPDPERRVTYFLRPTQ
jgi:hypothetical protein